MGWVPEGEWDEARAEKSGRRKPAQFLSAQEFITQMENSMPQMRERLRHTTEELVKTNKKLSEMFDVMQEEKRLQKEAVARARADERAKLEREMDQSVETADTEAYKKAKDRIAELDAEEKSLPPPKKEEKRQQDRNPEIESWIGRTPWWEKDQVLTSLMVDTFGRVQNRNPQMSTTEQLEEAERQVRLKHPERFPDNPRRQQARRNMLPTGERETGNDVDRRFAALPPEDRAAYEKQKKMFDGRKIKFTKAEFLADYYGEG